MSALSIFPLSLISTISAVSIQPNAHDQAAHSALSLRNQHNCKWPLPLRPQPLLLRHAKSEIGTSEPIQCGTDNAIPVCDNLRNRLLTVSSFTFEVAATTRQKSSSERLYWMLAINSPLIIKFPQTLHCDNTLRPIILPISHPKLLFGTQVLVWPVHIRMQRFSGIERPVGVAEHLPCQ